FHLFHRWHGNLGAVTKLGMGTGLRMLLHHGGPPLLRVPHDSAHDCLELKLRPVGLLLAVLLTSAGLDDGVAAPLLLRHVHPDHFPRLVTIFADQKYHHHPLDAWMAGQRPGWHIEVQARPVGTKGFTPLEKRWVIERTNAWHSRCRRNSKDY